VPVTKMIVRASMTVALLLSVSVAAMAQTLPSGWTARDIGTVGATGISSGTFNVEGAGADIWGSADGFQFAYTTLTGDGTVVSQVTGVTRVADWTKAGVMMRETLTAGSRHAMMLVSAGKGLAFQRRTSTGGTSTHTSGGSGTAPTWVKLKRAGSTFTAYRSPDGVNWTVVGSDTISMASTIYVGVAVSSHTYGVLATANFASTSVTRTATTTTTTSTGSTSTLRVLHWNTHHGGIGTDGRYDPDRIARWIAQINPDVISLNEVDSIDQMNAIISRLSARTGRTWTTAVGMKGNVLASKLPVDRSLNCTYNASYPRIAAQMAMTVNGRPVNLWSVHLAVDSGTTRLNEVKTLVNGCEATWAEARIVAGDFNMQSGSTEYTEMAKTHGDAWLAARALGTAVNYSGNCDGCTRNSRIDYVWLSKGATFASVTSAQIFDTRDASGVMPSDHKPMLVVYNIR
jgi:endonuclease/exonuclease/phosphatase family metal-dependent hydrolase